MPNPLYPDPNEAVPPQYALPVEAPVFDAPAPLQITVRPKPKYVYEAVEHDPFEQNALEAEGKRIREERRVPKVSDANITPGSIADRLTGNSGTVERFQTWPERLAREALEAPHKALTGEIKPGSDEEIAAAQALAGFAGVGAMPGIAKNALGMTGGKMVQPEIKAPVFYSAVEHAVDNIPQAKMPADQWLGTLANKPGVKPEELDWLGVKDFLAEKGKEPVSKQEMQDYVKAHKIELNEVNKLEKNPEVNPFSKEENNRVVDLVNDEGLTTAQAEARVLAARGIDNLSGQPKFQEWQLPGGENYREKLLTLPDTRKIGPKTFDEWAKQNNLKDGPEARKKYVEWNANNRNITGGNNFKSGHWDEPNVLAHVRMNDRDVGGKKSLHLEEIQSDWLQKGRDQGFKPSPEQRAKMEAIDEKIVNSNDEAILGHPDIKEAVKMAVDKKIITPEEAKTYLDVTRGENSSIPDAPFKKSWHELVLKRMLREAAENGYDRLSWTPGEAQAARYDLSKQLDSLKVYKDDKGNFKIYGKKLGSNEFEHLASDVSPEKLENSVGKEMAQKIIERDKTAKPYENIKKLPEGYSLIRDANGKKNKQEWGILPPNQAHAQSYTGRYHATEKEAIDAALDRMNGEARNIHDNKNNTYENADLKIGGEGMKGFYDQIVPKALEKIGKEHGVKVQQTTIPVGPAHKSLAHFMEWAKTNYGEKYSRNQLGTFWEQGDKIPIVKEFINSKKQKPIHYIDIPQSLKDTAMKKGFPLFSGGVMFVPVENDPWHPSFNHKAHSEWRNNFGN